MTPLGTPKITSRPGTVAVSTLPDSLAGEFRKRQGELLKLTPQQEKRVKAWLKKRLEEWRTDTADLHEILKDDNDLVEGVVLESDYPWVGASNMHVPITEMYMEVYKSVFKRSILGADSLWYGETDDDDLKEVLPAIEDMMNYKARHEWNIEHCLSNVFWTTSRDGLGAIQCTWAEEYEKKRDVILIVGREDFEAQFPSPEEAGIPEEEWFDLWQKSVDATEDFPLEVQVQFEEAVYLGCKGEVVELVNFVMIPAWCPDIRHESRRGYGKRYFSRGGTLRKKAKDGVFYRKAVNKLLSDKSSSDRSEYVQAQDEIEGLGRMNLADNYELFELVIKGSLDGSKGEEEEFLVTYSEEKDCLLEIKHYYYRTEMYALFRINERPNRLIGRSVPRKTADMNDEIDTQHNQRINARTVGTVPSFKALKSKKLEIDGQLQENQWRPGVIFYLDDFNAFEQFKVQPTDLGESMAEEKNDLNILDLYLGSAVSLLSGGSAPGDPSAPGNKTAIMIQQSNLRMDDPLSDLRQGVSRLGEICLSHTYQFGPPVLRYQKEMDAMGGQVVHETQTLHKRFLRRGIRMHMAGVTVTQNADAEMMKRYQVHQMLMTEEMYATNPQLRIEGLRDALRAGRVPGRQRLLPPPQAIEQMQIDIQKKAMIQMKMEADVAAQQQAQAAMAERVKGAQEQLKIRDTARKLAEANMARAESSVNGASE